MMKEKIKQRLIKVAQQRATITYGDLGEDPMGISRSAISESTTRTDMMDMYCYLDNINDETMCERQVLLSVVVVTEAGGLPGKGFFEKVAAGKWGDKKKEKLEMMGCKKFFAEECKLVYGVYCRNEKLT